jgi:hypothetical protein
LGNSSIIMVGIFLYLYEKREDHLDLRVVNHNRQQPRNMIHIS